MKKIFWVDTETSGLDSQKQDILQLAYLIEINGKIEAEGNLFIQPFDYTTVDKAALEVNKLTLDQIRKFTPPQMAYKDLTKVLTKYVNKYDKNDKFSPAGYNVNFDVGFMQSFFKKNNDKYFGSLFNYHLIDPITFLYILDSCGKLKLPNYKLETVATHFKIKLSAHDALSDIYATRSIYYKLMEYLK